MGVGDWGFWAAAGAMSLVVAASLIAALFRRREVTLTSGAYDLQVYRAQLADLDRDVASDVVSAGDAERLRAEISRRILEADRLGRGDAKAMSQSATLLAGGLVGLALLGAVWGYVRLGAPGYPDLPLAERLTAAAEFSATRPSQAEAEAAAGAPEVLQPDAETADLMTKLRRAVADRPGDGAGLRLLVTNEAALGNLSAARDALVRLMDLKSADLGSDHAQMAELLIRLADGYVSPEAEAELMRALQREPENGTALYYLGLMFAQGDRADRAFTVWQKLLDSSAPDDPWVAPIRAQIADIAARAGVNYEPPQAVGPTADQVGAAADMTPEDRLAMIQSMVDGLSQRLATKGGPVEDWARLITSLGVLGDTDQARAIYTEGQTTFAGRAAELDVLRAAAVAAGVAE
jgi:cytochrome c-type biogenesis protein CcmH